MGKGIDKVLKIDKKNNFKPLSKERVKLKPIKFKGAKKF